MKTLLIMISGLLLQTALASAATDLSAQERLKSCDPNMAIAAAKEIIRNPATLKEPLELFSVSSALFRHGKKDEAIFWFYAAQLRVKYQLVFEGGDRGQLLGVMLMTEGPIINSYAFQDVSKLDRILDRVLEWDRKAPNPFRTSSMTESADKQVEQIYVGLSDLRAKLKSDKDDIERKARLTPPDIARAYAEAANSYCGKGQLDPAYAERAMQQEWTLVTSFVRANADVAREAGEISKVYPESHAVKRTEVLPSRYIVSVIGRKTVYAVVDVSRSGGKPSLSLTCVSHLPLGKRDSSKDVCAQ